MTAEKSRTLERGSRSQPHKVTISMMPVFKFCNGVIEKCSVKMGRTFRRVKIYFWWIIGNYFAIRWGFCRFRESIDSRTRSFPDRIFLENGNFYRKNVVAFFEKRTNNLVDFALFIIDYSMFWLALFMRKLFLWKCYFILLYWIFSERYVKGLYMYTVCIMFWNIYLLQYNDTIFEKKICELRFIQNFDTVMKSSIV